MFEIHTSAKNNFDARAKALLDGIQEYPREHSSHPKFDTEVHVSATLTDEDIIGDPQETVSDYQGNATGRYFIFKNKRYGLIDEGYYELVKLSERIQQLPTFQDRLSRSFVEKQIFLWLRKSFIFPEEYNSCLDDLVEKSKEVVKPITVYVPLANTIVEQPFRFCGVVICNITKSLIDEMSKAGEATPNEEQSASPQSFFDKFRKDYQGYASVKIELTCEPEYANEVAIQIAQRVTSFLGIYSGAVLMPDVKCTSKIKGTENLAQSTTICISEENTYSITSKILDLSSARHWHISRQDLSDFSKCGLGIISEMACKHNPSKFESLLLNTAALYSKSAFTSEPLDKLVYMLSALESTLLKNESEPIQQNLAERLAIFTSQELKERKEIIKCVKAAYGFRSRYLHHGHSSGDLEQLRDFFVRVWVFYVNLISNYKVFTNKDEFINALDDHKLG